MNKRVLSLLLHVLGECFFTLCRLASYVPKIRRVKQIWQLNWKLNPTNKKGPEITFATPRSIYRSGFANGRQYFSCRPKIWSLFKNFMTMTKSTKTGGDRLWTRMDVKTPSLSSANNRVCFLSSMSPKGPCLRHSFVQIINLKKCSFRESTQRIWNIRFRPQKNKLKWTVYFGRVDGLAPTVYKPLKSHLFLNVSLKGISSAKKWVRFIFAINSTSQIALCLRLAMKAQEKAWNPTKSTAGSKTDVIFTFANPRCYFRRMRYGLRVY